MITVENLHFTYPGGKSEAVKGISFEISKGEILGFLGPSGAGKSTTQKILIGLLKGYEGRVSVMGREIHDWGQDYYERVGVGFELPNHYLKLTGLENLRYFASLYTGQTADPIKLLAQLGLEDAADMRVAQYSKGMKARLNFARSLLNKPEILFLDEPTTGLDPVNVRIVKDMILKQREEGTTVFVTTHNMTVADELSDRVAFIVNGKIDILDTPEALKKRYGQRLVRVEYLNGAATPEVRQFALDGLGDNSEFLSILKQHHIETLHSAETTLENIFIQVTGQELA